MDLFAISEKIRFENDEIETHYCRSMTQFLFVESPWSFWSKGGVIRVIGD